MIIEKYDPFNTVVSMPLYQAKAIGSLLNYLRQLGPNAALTPGYIHSVIFTEMHAAGFRLRTEDVASALNEAAMTLGTLTKQIVGPQHETQQDEEQAEGKVTVH